MVLAYAITCNTTLLTLMQIYKLVLIKTQLLEFFKCCYIPTDQLWKPLTNLIDQQFKMYLPAL